MKLQCKVSNVLRRHDDELSVRFEIVSDFNTGIAKKDIWSGRLGCPAKRTGRCR